MDKILATLKARFKEPSSWGGLAILALVALNVIPAEVGIQLMSVAGGGIDPGLALPIAETVAAVPVEESTNWLKIALNVIGVAAGVGGVGSMILGEGGKKAIMAFAVVPLFMLGLGSQEAIAADMYTFQVGWDIPTSRQNGVALEVSEIGGYLVSVTNPDGSSSELEVLGGANNLGLFPVNTPGVYDFTVQTFDTDNVYSVHSDKVTKGLGSPIARLQNITITIVCESGSSCTFDLLE